MSELLDLPITALRAHPDNPRLQLRDDVVTQIAAEITRSGFGREHALLVRPVGESFEILSGHHRNEAAKRVGLETVPCWVRDMDDEEAFMTLILANTQGELSALEEGHHVHYFVERGGVGGRGNKGGLRDYARRLNKDEAGLRQRQAAYSVYQNCVHSTHFLALASHKALYEISKAPQACWQPLTQALATRGWTVKETSYAVAEVAKFDIPDRHVSWLPQTRIVGAYLTAGQPTPGTVQRLVDSADSVLDAISRDGDEKDAAKFQAWLVANTGGQSWDHRKVSVYHAELIVEWSERRDELDGGRIRIEHCRASDLLQFIEPGTADLIFTDPPYPVEFVECWTELGELAVKILKPGGLLVAYTGQYTMPEALDRLRATGLSWYWCYAVAHAGAFFRMNATHVQCGWKPLLVMRNGVGDLPNWHKDFVSDGSREKANDEWQQAESEAAYWLSELSRPDDLVIDPFIGGGTTAAACKSLGRRFIGCDINEADVQKSRQRVM